MKDMLLSRIRESANAVKYWWLLLIAGIAVAIVGILAFVYPFESYLASSILFGCLVLFMGISYTVFAISNNKHLAGWGWYLARGILEILFGLILCFSPAASALALPVFLGVWIMFAGISAIVTATDLKQWGVKGTGWSIFAGVLLIISSLIILWNPFTVGMPTIVIFIGIGLLIFGIQLIMNSLTLQKIHHHFKEIQENFSGKK